MTRTEITRRVRLRMTAARKKHCDKWVGNPTIRNVDRLPALVEEYMEWLTAKGRKAQTYELIDTLQVIRAWRQAIGISSDHFRIMEATDAAQGFLAVAQGVQDADADLISDGLWELENHVINQLECR